MKTAGELAREYADETYPSADSNDYSRTTAEEWDACYDGYMGGYSEATRWRDPKEELPEEDTQVIIKGGILKPEIGLDFENPHCVGYYCDGVWYVSPTDYYSIEIENPTGWRPI